MLLSNYKSYRRIRGGLWFHNQIQTSIDRYEVWERTPSGVKQIATENWDKPTSEPVGKTSDGYHTFDELYEHRCLLWANLLNNLSKQKNDCFKTLLDSNGKSWQGWFIAGINTDGKQISYHLPYSLWDCVQVPTIEKNIKYDGHTSKDVIDRLYKMLKIS